MEGNDDDLDSKRENILWKTKTIACVAGMVLTDVQSVRALAPAVFAIVVASHIVTRISFFKARYQAPTGLPFGQLVEGEIIAGLTEGAIISIGARVIKWLFRVAFFS